MSQTGQIQKRISAVVLALAFFSQDLSWAAPPEGLTLPGALRGEGQTLLSMQGLIQNPTLFEAPLQFTSLREIHHGSKDVFIIHIQDAHSNLSGQQNLAGALDEIMTKYPVSLVLSEGGAGDCSLTKLREAAPSEDRVKRVAKNFLISGQIQGEEYLNLVSNHPMKIMGLEDMPLYLRSLQSYSKLAQKREGILEYLKQMRRSLEKLKKKNYPKEILSYENVKSTSLGSSGEDFESPFKALLKISGDKRIALDEFPNLKKLESLLEKEKTIDFDAANLEQAALVEKIASRADKEEFQKYLDMAQKLKGAKAAQFAYFQKTLNIASSKYIEMDAYANWVRYGDYLKDFSNIDLEAMLEELVQAEDRIYEAVLADPDAKLIRSVDRYLALLEKAYRIQMTNKDFNLWIVNEPDFSTASYQAFLNRKLADAGYYEDLIPYQTILEEGKGALIEFYDSVAERDLAFMANTEKALSQENQKVAVLISGGYHTEHLAQLFKEQGYSYAVLTPSVTSETNQRKYEKLLMEPLEENKARVETTHGQTRSDQSLGNLGKNFVMKKPAASDLRVSLVTGADARMALLSTQLGIPQANILQPSINGARLVKYHVPYAANSTNWDVGNVMRDLWRTEDMAFDNEVSASIATAQIQAKVQRRKARVLVIGSGAGRAVYDLRTAYPDVELHFINKEKIELDPNPDTAAEIFSWYTSKKEEQDVHPAVSKSDAVKFLDYFRKNVRLHDVDQGLPYEAGFFDRVLVTKSTFEYPQNKAELLRETKRVLRQGGEAFINSFETFKIQDMPLQDFFGSLPKGEYEYRKVEQKYPGHFFETLKVVNKNPNSSLPPLELISSAEGNIIPGYPTYENTYKVIPVLVWKNLGTSEVAKNFSENVGYGPSKRVYISLRFGSEGVFEAMAATTAPSVTHVSLAQTAGIYHGLGDSYGQASIFFQEGTPKNIERILAIPASRERGIEKTPSDMRKEFFKILRWLMDSYGIDDQSQIRVEINPFILTDAEIETEGFKHAGPDGQAYAFLKDVLKLPPDVMGVPSAVSLKNLALFNANTDARQQSEAGFSSALPAPRGARLTTAKFISRIETSEKNLSESRLKKIRPAMAKDTKELLRTPESKLLNTLEKLMEIRERESLDRLEESDTRFEALHDTRRKSITDAITALKNDCALLISLQSTSEQKRSAAVIYMNIFHLLLMQDEADITLPYVSHSIKHSLNVRTGVKEVIEHSEKTRESLTQIYGRSGQALAILSAWIHDVGYGLLTDAMEQASKIAKESTVPDYKPGKGYHTRLGVILLETPLEDGVAGSSLFDQIDKLFGLSQKKGNAEGSQNAMDDLRIMVLAHGADKNTEEGLPGTGQHRYRPASTTKDILNFLVRLADNLDIDAETRLYSYQHNPFFLGLLQDLFEQGVATVEKIKAAFTSPENLEVLQASYAVHLQLKEGMSEEAAQKKAEDDFKIVVDNIKAFDETNFPHFGGMVEEHEIIEKNGKLIIRVQLNRANLLIPENVTRYQAERMQKAYGSLDFNGNKIEIEVYHPQEQALLATTMVERTQPLIGSLKIAAEQQKDPNQKILLNALVNYVKRNPDTPLLREVHALQNGNTIVRFRESANVVRDTDVLPLAEQDNVYILLEGSATVQTESGRKVDLNPGDIFGEMAIITGKRTAKVTVSSPNTSVIVLSSDEFRKLLEDPQFLIAYGRIVADRRKKQNLDTVITQGNERGENPMVITAGLRSNKDYFSTKALQPNILIANLDHPSEIETFVFQNTFFQSGIQGVQRTYGELAKAVSAAPPEQRAEPRRKQEEFLSSARKKGFNDILAPGIAPILSRRSTILVKSEQEKRRIQQILLHCFIGGNGSEEFLRILNQAGYNQEDLKKNEDMAQEFSRQRSFVFKGGLFHGLDETGIIEKLDQVVSIQVLEEGKPIEISQGEGESKNTVKAIFGEGVFRFEERGRVYQVKERDIDWGKSHIQSWNISQRQILRSMLGASRAGQFRFAALGNADPTPYSGQQDYTNLIFAYNEKFVLVDPSPVTIKNMQEGDGALMDQVEVIYLSHIHWDHIGGLVHLVYDNLERMKRGEPVRRIKLIASAIVYQQALTMISAMTEGICQQLPGRQHQNFKQIFDEMFERVSPEIKGEEENYLILNDEYGGLHITTRRTYGHPVPTFGFQIRTPQGTLAYLVDSTMPPEKLADRRREFIDFYGSSDVLISENGVPGVHIEPKQLYDTFTGNREMGTLLTVHSSLPQNQEGLQRLNIFEVHFIENKATRRAGLDKTGQLLVSTNAIRNLWNLSPELRDRVAKIGTPLSFSRGAIIFREGEPIEENPYLYIVLEGSLSIEAVEGRTHLLRHAGEIIGEIAILMKEIDTRRYKRQAEMVAGKLRQFIEVYYIHDLRGKLIKHYIWKEDATPEKIAEALSSDLDLQETSLKLFNESIHPPRSRTVTTSTDSLLLRLDINELVKILGKQVETTAGQKRTVETIFESLIRRRLDEERLLQEDSTAAMFPDPNTMNGDVKKPADTESTAQGDLAERQIQPKGFNWLGSVSLKKPLLNVLLNDERVSFRLVGDKIFISDKDNKPIGDIKDAQEDALKLSLNGEDVDVKLGFLAGSIRLTNLSSKPIQTAAGARLALVDAESLEKLVLTANADPSPAIQLKKQAAGPVDSDVYAGALLIDGRRAEFEFTAADNDLDIKFMGSDETMKPFGTVANGRNRIISSGTGLRFKVKNLGEGRIQISNVSKDSQKQEISISKALSEKAPGKNLIILGNLTEETLFELLKNGRKSGEGADMIWRSVMMLSEGAALRLNLNFVVGPRGADGRIVGKWEIDIRDPVLGDEEVLKRLRTALSKYEEEVFEAVDLSGSLYNISADSVERLGADEGRAILPPGEDSVPVLINRYPAEHPELMDSAFIQRKGLKGLEETRITHSKGEVKEFLDSGLFWAVQVNGVKQIIYSPRDARTRSTTIKPRASQEEAPHFEEFSAKNRYKIKVGKTTLLLSLKDGRVRVAAEEESERFVEASVSDLLDEGGQPKTTISIGRMAKSTKYHLQLSHVDQYVSRDHMALELFRRDGNVFYRIMNRSTNWEVVVRALIGVASAAVKGEVVKALRQTESGKVEEYLIPASSVQIINDQAEIEKILDAIKYGDAEENIQVFKGVMPIVPILMVDEFSFMPKTEVLKQIKDGKLRVIRVNGINQVVRSDAWLSSKEASNGSLGARLSDKFETTMKRLMIFSGVITGLATFIYTLYSIYARTGPYDGHPFVPQGAAEHIFIWVFATALGFVGGIAGYQLPIMVLGVVAVGTVMPVVIYELVKGVPVVIFKIVIHMLEGNAKPSKSALTVDLKNRLTNGFVLPVLKPLEGPLPEGKGGTIYFSSRDIKAIIKRALIVYGLAGPAVYFLAPKVLSNVLPILLPVVLAAIIIPFAWAVLVKLAREFKPVGKQVLDVAANRTELLLDTLKVRGADGKLLSRQKKDKIIEDVKKNILNTIREDAYGAVGWSLKRFGYAIYINQRIENKADLEFVFDHELIHYLKLKHHLIRQDIPTAEMYAIIQAIKDRQIDLSQFPSTALVRQGEELFWSINDSAERNKEVESIARDLTDAEADSNSAEPRYTYNMGMLQVGVTTAWVEHIKQSYLEQYGRPTSISEHRLRMDLVAKLASGEGSKNRWGYIAPWVKQTLSGATAAGERKVLVQPTFAGARLAETDYTTWRTDDLVTQLNADVVTVNFYNDYMIRHQGVGAVRLQGGSALWEGPQARQFMEGTLVPSLKAISAELRERGRRTPDYGVAVNGLVHSYFAGARLSSTYIQVNNVGDPLNLVTGKDTILVIEDQVMLLYELLSDYLGNAQIVLARDEETALYAYQQIRQFRAQQDPNMRVVVVTDYDFPSNSREPQVKPLGLQTVGKIRKEAHQGPVMMVTSRGEREVFLGTSPQNSPEKVDVFINKMPNLGFAPLLAQAIYRQFGRDSRVVLQTQGARAVVQQEIGARLAINRLGGLAQARLVRTSRAVRNPNIDPKKQILLVNSADQALNRLEGAITEMDSANSTNPAAFADEIKRLRTEEAALKVDLLSIGQLLESVARNKSSAQTSVEAEIIKFFLGYKNKVAVVLRNAEAVNLPQEGRQLAKNVREDSVSLAKFIGQGNFQGRENIQKANLLTREAQARLEKLEKMIQSAQSEQISKSADRVSKSKATAGTKFLISPILQGQVDEQDVQNLSSDEIKAVERLVAYMRPDEIKSDKQHSFLFRIEKDGVVKKYGAILQYQPAEQGGDIRVLFYRPAQAEEGQQAKLLGAYLVPKERINKIREEDKVTQVIGSTKAISQDLADLQAVSIVREVSRLDRMALSKFSTAIVIKLPVILKYRVDQYFVGWTPEMFAEFNNQIASLKSRYGALSVQYIDGQGALVSDSRFQSDSVPSGEIGAEMIIGAANQENIKLAIRGKAGLLPVNSTISGSQKVIIRANIATAVLAILIGLLNVKGGKIQASSRELEGMASLHEQMVRGIENHKFVSQMNRVERFQAMRMPRQKLIEILIRLALDPIARLDWNEVMRYIKAQIAVGAAA